MKIFKKVPVPQSGFVSKTWFEWNNLVRGFSIQNKSTGEFIEKWYYFFWLTPEQRSAYGLVDNEEWLEFMKSNLE